MSERRGLIGDLSRNTWRYRVVRQVIDGETFYGVHEAYDGGTSWTTNPVAPVSDSVEGLRAVLRRMAMAPEFEVIDDIPAPVGDDREEEK